MIIFDTSAVIALALYEKGFEKVVAYIGTGKISCVNWSEVIAVMTRKTGSENINIDTLREIVKEIIPFDAQQAEEAGYLIAKTKHLGLSLGDRACLVLAQQMKLPVLTADRSWSTLDIGVDVQVIR